MALVWGAIGIVFFWYLLRAWPMGSARQASPNTQELHRATITELQGVRGSVHDLQQFARERTNALAKLEKAVRQAEGERIIIEGVPGWLAGNGSYRLQAVGESHYWEAFETICGPSAEREEGIDLNKRAEVVLEDDNPYDVHAVAVHIQGLKVGHLSQRDARAFRERLVREHLTGSCFPCAANIRGGWNRPGDFGNYGVRLDVGLYD
jgi:hypothetical protein